jgi:sucrose-phosphate synthase
MINWLSVQVLDNGLLVDPHDQKSIADALLKLVSNKQLWAKCRQNGLKNIHLFSWPEHCKTYLSKIATCKPRHPHWQRSEDGGESSESEESPGDSLRDIQDLSLNLKFSLDGEKNGDSGNDNSFDPDGNATDRSAKLENAVLSWSKGISKDLRRGGSAEKSGQNSNAGKFPPLRSRNRLFVIAVDCDTTSGLLEMIKVIFEAAGEERTEGSVGFILSTSMTISEIQSFLASGGLSPSDFDAYICNSGSDLYYPSLNPEDRLFVGDLYFHSHIEYRWGGEGLRKTLVRWAGSTTNKKGESNEQIVSPAEQLSTDYCYAFKVRKAGMVIFLSSIHDLV